MRKWILPLVLCTVSLSLFSCKNKEQDDLAKAQKCLDDVPQTDPTLANACLAYVEKYNSQQANILKCSIHMTAGGLIESKMVKGYQALENDDIQNKEAAFMAVLALDRATYTEGFTKAVTALQYCQQTGVPGLEYISNIIVAGSAMAKALETLTIPMDINDPNSIKTAVENLVNQCTSGAPPPECTADAAAMGGAVVTLAESYCGTADADAGACDQVNEAVQAAGGDPTKVAQALYCYMEKPPKTYNPGTGLCQ